MPLSDAEAKKYLSCWPQHTRVWSRQKESIGWLRAQPKTERTAGPRLELPGAGAFRTQPDGLWVSLGIAGGDTTTQATFVDATVIESCRTQQNFSDKRSRYAARTTSLVVSFSDTWLNAQVTVQRGARRSRRDILRGNLPEGEPISLPVRHLRVLYALPTDDASPSLFDRVCSSMVLEAHEYVCPQRTLASYTGQPMQRFLKRMAPGLQRYP